MTLIGVVGQRDSSGTGPTATASSLVTPRMWSPGRPAANAEPTPTPIVIGVAIADSQPVCDGHACGDPADGHRRRSSRGGQRTSSHSRGRDPAQRTGGRGERRGPGRERRDPDPRGFGDGTPAPRPVGRADRHPIHEVGDGEPPGFGCGHRPGDAGRVGCRRGGRPAASGRRTRRGWSSSAASFATDRDGRRRRPHVHAQRRKRTGPRLRLSRAPGSSNERSHRRLGGAARRGRSADDQGGAERRLPDLAPRPSRCGRGRERDPPAPPRRAGRSVARTRIPKPSPSPGAAVRVSRPILAAGSEPSGQSGPTKPRGSVAAAPPVPRIPVPLAAGLGGLAGLLILAWRHGTLRRAMAELAASDLNQLASRGRRRR